MSTQTPEQIAAAAKTEARKPKPAAKPKKPAAPAKPKEPTITVVGPKEGRRRIGRRFGKEPAEIKLSDLKKGEIEALKADPRLIVSDGTAS